MQQPVDAQRRQPTVGCLVLDQHLPGLDEDGLGTVLQERQHPVDPPRQVHGGGPGVPDPSHLVLEPGLVPVLAPRLRRGDHDTQRTDGPQRGGTADRQA